MPGEPSGSVAGLSMKRHFITFLFLVLAIVLYSIGAAGPGTFLLLLGVLAEATFWVRVWGNGKAAKRNRRAQ